MPSITLVNIVELNIYHIDVIHDLGHIIFMCVAEIKVNNKIFLKEFLFVY